MSKAANAVRNARGELNKKLKSMGVKKLLRPDDLHKAIEEMEKIVERGQRDVRGVFERAIKALEQDCKTGGQSPQTISNIQLRGKCLGRY